MQRRSAVIGGGPAGCAAAHALGRGGRQVVIFERAPALGGRTTTWRDDGLVVDSGAGFFTSFYPTLTALVDEVGLAGEVRAIARSTALVDDGGRTAALTVGSVRSFAAYPFLGAGAKLRLAAATAGVMARFRALDLSRPETLAAVDDRSVAADAIARVGEEAYHYVVRPGIEPFWYFSCAEVSRALSLALLARAATARFYALAGGMDTICSALAASASVRHAAVDAVRRDGDGVVVCSAAGEERFDDAVIATTASEAARLTAGVALPAAIGDFLSTQRYAPNVHAAFVVPRDGAQTRTALFPCGRGTPRVAAISWNASKAQGISGARDVVSVFLSADESRRWLDADDAATFAHAWSLGRALCPSLPADAQPFRVVRRAEAIPVHAVGRYRLAAAAQRAQRAPLVFAGDHLATATVDGALRTGLGAAAALLADAR